MKQSNDKVARIIVVNDNQIQLKYLSSLLKNQDFDVSSYESPEDAFVDMKGMEVPDLIITDIHMPGIDGWRFIRLLRSPEYKTYNSVPILAVSATFSGDEVSRITSDLGANAFMPAPVNKDDFIVQVNALLNNEEPVDFINVMIVEDSRSLAGLLQRTFSNTGYNADICKTSKEAISTFKNKKYDIVILDFHLPDGSGEKLLVKFKKLHSDCVYIMMTTDPNPELALNWMKKGASAYIHKPFEPAYLIEICARVRREHALLRVESLLEKRTIELSESERRFNTYFKHSTIGMCMTSVEKGWLEVNNTILNMFGYTRKELFELKWSEITHPDDIETDLEQFEQLMAHKMDGYTLRKRFIRKDESIVYTTISVNAIKKSDGMIDYFLALIHDISDQKKKEDEKEKILEQLRQSQKLEAVGQLAGGIAHDFNNLLQVIKGYSDLILYKIQPDDPIYDSVNNINDAGDKASGLVNQLLAFSRRQVLRMTDVDMNELIANILKMIRRLIGEYIKLDFIPGHDLGVISADKGQIEQIIMNLCVNSRDSIVDSGTIILETENVLIDEDYCKTHVWADPGRYIQLSVTDTGHGMDKETVNNVFEPFFTTKVVGKGTGLGLSTVYGLVKQHKGMIHAYSEVDKGTTFKIYFPIIERSAISIDNKIKGEIPGGNETILIAEDDEMVLELAKTFLELGGYKVLTAFDGKEAIQVFEQNADKIDLILLDVIMPELGGKAVFEHIIKDHPDMHFLFASGYSMNAIHTNFVLHDGMTLIQKPYQRDSLLRKVREVLDK